MFSQSDYSSRLPLINFILKDFLSLGLKYSDGKDAEYLLCTVSTKNPNGVDVKNVEASNKYVHMYKNFKKKFLQISKLF